MEQVLDTYFSDGFEIKEIQTDDGKIVFKLYNPHTESFVITDESITSIYRKIDDIFHWYFDSQGQYCPYCNNEEIERFEPEVEDDFTFMVQKRCPQCEATWKDIYECVDVKHPLQ